MVANMHELGVLGQDRSRHLALVVVRGDVQQCVARYVACVLGTGKTIVCTYGRGCVYYFLFSCFFFTSFYCILFLNLFSFYGKGGCGTS